MRETGTTPPHGQRLRSRDAILAESLLKAFVPLADPPEGELPDADHLAALIEGRLPMAEVARLIRRIDGSAAARCELATLAPDVFARHFPEKQTSGPPQSIRLRVAARTTAVALAALAAALIAIFVLPYAPPEGASLGVRVQPLERGLAPLADVMRPGQWATLQLSAGRIRPIDQARGGAPWVTLYQVNPLGERSRLCSSADASCALVGGRVPLSWRAPEQEGTYTLVLLAGSTDPAAADQLEGPGGLTALENAATAAGWTRSVHVLQVQRGQAGGLD